MDFKSERFSRFIDSLEIDPNTEPKRISSKITFSEGGKPLARTKDELLDLQRRFVALYGSLTGFNIQMAPTMQYH